MATKKASAAAKTADAKAEKPAAKKTAAKKSAAVKTEETAAAVTVSEKEAVTKKTPVKKAPAKKATVKEEVVLQFSGREIRTEDLMKQVKEIWTKVRKKKAGDMKSVSLYVKPEENAAYYVVNGEESGKIEL